MSDTGSNNFIKADLSDERDFAPRRKNRTANPLMASVTLALNSQIFKPVPHIPFRRNHRPRIKHPDQKDPKLAYTHASSDPVSHACGSDAPLS